MRAFNKTRTRSVILVSSLAALLLALSLPAPALAQPDGPPSALEPASPISAAIADLHTLVLIIAAGVFVVVEGLILIAAFRFRRRAALRDAGEPPQIHGNTRLEIAWTVAPAIIVVALFVLGVRAQQNMDAAAHSAEPGVPITVEVMGHQWWWEFRYPEFRIATAGQMVIPAGRVINLQITSADVIHSFWVPELGGKTDAIMGVINRSVLRANQPGDFYGQCAELCGVSHAYMRLVVTAVSEDEFAAWVTSQAMDAAEPTEPAAQAGKQVFENHPLCVGCHTLRGIPRAVGHTGPDLTHVASRPYIAGGTLANTPHNLARWLSDPPAIKPGTVMRELNLSPSDVDALVAYLQTLK